MAKVLNKMMGLLGLEDEEYEDEVNDVEAKGDGKEEKIEPIFSNSGKSQNKVVNIHSSANAKLIIVRPENFEEAQSICDDLKNRKIVVVNTTNIEPKMAQRLLDFIGGASFALGGGLQEVEKGVYILSPSNVDVTTALKNELSNKGLFNWNK